MYLCLIFLYLSTYLIYANISTVILVKSQKSLDNKELLEFHFKAENSMNMLHYQPKLSETFLCLLSSNLLCTFLIAIRNNVNDKVDELCILFEDQEGSILHLRSKTDLQ